MFFYSKFPDTSTPSFSVWRSTSRTDGLKWTRWSKMLLPSTETEINSARLKKRCRLREHTKRDKQCPSAMMNAKSKLMQTSDVWYNSFMQISIKLITYDNERYHWLNNIKIVQSLMVLSPFCSFRHLKSPVLSYWPYLWPH